jgi:hypothetical protein
VAASGYGDLPLAFEPNAGRYHRSVAFAAQTSRGSAFLTDRGLVLSAPAGRAHAAAVAIEPIGADLRHAVGAHRLPGVVNDLRGDDRSQWVRDIPTFARVRYSGAYPGIALEAHGTGRSLEYDFRIAPRADPARIRLAVRAADSLRLNASGDLVIRSGQARFVQHAPVAYQPAAGGRRAVDARFTVDGRRVGFALGPYDTHRPLVIDPLVLSYSTYLGGNSFDEGTAIVVDSSGSAYVTGQTDSTDFNTLNPIEGDSTGIDVFVSKLNPAGNGLVYSTYLGGSGFDSGQAIALGPSNTAYVGGFTDSTDFDQLGAIEGDSPMRDAFIAKLNAAGNALVYSTYLGGNDLDTVQGIAVDSTGSAFVAGPTDSTDFNTVGPIETNSTSTDVFVSKLNPAGSALTYSTYVGGAGQDFGTGIAIDGSGSAYVVGSTTSTDYDTVNPIEGNQPDTDAFVSKLNAGGSALTYSTYLGGSAGDFANGVDVDASGSAYLTGTTLSNDFNTVNPIPGSPGGVTQDAFVSKLNPAGSALSYSTYLGGNGVDSGADVDVDSSGAAYVGGSTASTDYETLGALPGHSGLSGTFDGFVSKLVPAGNALGYSTYVGGDGFDDVEGVAVGPADVPYFSGASDSTDFDTVNPIEGHSTSFDAVIFKLTTALPDTSITGGPPAAGTTADSTPTLTFTSPTPTTDFECRFDGGAFASCSGPGGAHTPIAPLAEGGHLFEVRAVDVFGGDASPASRVFTVDTVPPDTSLDSGPSAGSTTDDSTPTFSFSSNEAGTTFQCRYDSAGFGACSGPGAADTPASPLGGGSHTFQVRAVDTVGNRDFSPASSTFTVSAGLADTVPPDTAIDSGPSPGSTTGDSTPTFGFSSNESGASFECRYDSDPFASCSGPGATHTPGGALPDGAHAFSVRAIDGAGNRDFTPATSAFTVKTEGGPPTDTDPPQTTIDKAPKRSTKTAAKIAFSSSEAASSFQCKLDKAGFAPCTSPFKAAGLKPGKHAFAVFAIDPAGNPDSSPATASWKVKPKK